MSVEWIASFVPAAKKLSVHARIMLAIARSALLTSLAKDKK